VKRPIDFVHAWLWEGKDRQTTDMEWSAPFVNDAARMVAAARAEAMLEAAEIAMSQAPPEKSQWRYVCERIRDAILAAAKSLDSPSNPVR
jgi:hypothetical protein